MQIDFPRLKMEIQARYRHAASAVWSPIVNGDECLVWHIRDEGAPLIVRVSPAWRTLDELRWTHDLTIHCRHTVPEAVAPLAARDGSTLFEFEGYPVAVFPFVAGDTLDAANGQLVESAARLLARIHSAAASWPGQRARPASRTARPKPLDREAYPSVLLDHEFDQWRASLADAGLSRGLVHCDFYPRNVLATETAITGLIDWDDVDEDWYMAEVAWSAWEFCQNSEGDDLDTQAARAFLAAYFDEGAPCPATETAHAVQFIRRRLRREIAFNLGQKARGRNWSPEYTEAEMRAFVALKDRQL